MPSPQERGVNVFFVMTPSPPDGGRAWEGSIILL